MTYGIMGGYIDSILTTRGDRVGHKTVESALSSILAVTSMTRDEVVLVHVDDGAVLVYRNQEDADFDTDGSRAQATIVPMTVSVSDIRDFAREAGEAGDLAGMWLAEEALEGDADARAVVSSWILDARGNK